MKSMTEILKIEIESQYGSIRKFSEALGTPSSTLNSAFKKNLKGTSVNTVIEMCKLLNLDINELVEGKLVRKDYNENKKQNILIGENIKHLRESHSMSQKELAEIAGVTDKAVSTWESGINIPRMGAIQKIADYFKIKKSEIIEGKELSEQGDFIIKDGKTIKYEDLPEEGQKELESYFQYLKQKYKL